jgi:30S ribosomal protein S31
MLCVSCFFIVLKLFKTINIDSIMGRGDAKTKKGKIFSGSFGKARPAKQVKKDVAPAAKKKD